MTKLSSVMTDIVVLIFKDMGCHVIIFADIFFIGTGFPFFVILEFDITGNPIVFQIQEVFLAAVSTVCCHFIQYFTKGFLMLLQNWDQGVIICTVIAHVSVNDEIVLHRDLNVVSWF